MTTFVSLLVNGISQGAVYALIALGFVIIFKASEVLNFAHGSMLLLGAYVIARLVPSVGFAAAVAIGVASTALLAVLLERLLFSRVGRNKGLGGHGQVAALTIMTLGLDIVIVTDMARRIGSGVLSLDQPWGSGAFSFGDVAITYNRLIAIATAAVLILAFLAAFRFSGWGVALRASAEDAETAALMGIRRWQVSALAWLLAGALAAVAAVFLTGSPTPGLEPSIRTVAFAAFPAAILGGLDSTTGALVGGLIVGVVEAMAAGYSSHLDFLGGGFGAAVPYIVMLVILLARPAGLFGTRELARV
ncbi:branched-chain amino acid ABC transporter permease [Frankia sp. CNm7]|uniref:Branched-chain amino acid ABC transporter permease n=1 Tax=Frankia nepalensis TaxID=1836974 RepID=A0A937RVH1_9ACTN|nr:branched-chain amino acid ABC transporter permease [Frankia nepalensis]MBL7495287.1 branched-chain amino acid ABC transporter permease [Frankia nepalensis]MBL7512322.1 branched-chain amino acid ABC transporter permease [Frankia nepalensis]MBL7522036.1 branched-chain amino acid ABC transporter permease [Frankia nepalensis]MBL7632621.1 branched-chain amino acid ABC transporter permease [Frankia nepalensis]